jgi:integrase
MGKTWGETLTEKAVWHVVREYAMKAGIDKLAPHDLRRTCARLGYAAGGNWSKSSFCSVTFRFRPPNDISVANSGFKVLSMTKSE